MASPGRRFPHLADARDLEGWAERIEARSEFPRLVRRLIHQTNDQIVSLEMRAAEGTGFQGYDGEVEASRATPFVPGGASVWELGVGPPESKANADYRTRTDDPLGRDKTTTTFVFVTPRRWPRKSEWARERRAEGDWADVRAFDADDIEVAFESAPAAHFWFSQVVGLPVEGVRMIEGWWNVFSRLSDPNLTPELVLAGRADESAALLRLLEQETRITGISAASSDEILAFVAATLSSAPEPIGTDLLARTLIVHDAATLRRLDGTTTLLILVPFEDQLRREAQLMQSHHVVLLVPDGAQADIDLPPIDRDVFAAELMAAGVDSDRARQLAQSAYRSLVAFQADTPVPGVPRRDWSRAFESRIVRRAWLAGAWHETRSGDIDALSAFFGMPYEDARSELVPFAAGEDPVFATVGGAWALTSPEEAWRFGMARLAGPDLDSLETLVQTVLAAVDPALDLPITERWMASVHGKTRIHSADLRTGLATSLAAGGALGGGVSIGGIGTIADWTVSVAARLLRRANEDASGDLWASLTDVLPLLAEAAPDVFLRAVQEGVTERSEPLLAKMFIDQEGDGFSVSSPHTGLLWALESLAWSPEHASLSIKLLARLAEIDPGGRLSNRPLNSLVAIFRAWFPQTSLSVDRRIAVLDTIRRDHPEIAWKLMLRLLPEFHGVGDYTNSPRFRPWRPESQEITYGERWEFESAVGRRLVEDAEGTAARWLDVAQHFAQFLEEERSTALARLRELAESDALKEDERQKLWAELDKLVRHHRSYSTADWSLPEDDLVQIAAVAEAFEPRDPIQANSWLFDSYLPDIGYGKADIHEQRRQAEHARSSAVAEVLAVHGLEGLLQLAESVQFSGMVGAVAALNPSEELDERAIGLLDDEERDRREFAAGYTFQRAIAAGTGWIEDALTKLEGRPVSQARLLQASTDLQAAWRLAAALGDEVEAAYWHEFQTGGRGPDFEFVNEAAESLLRFGRPVAAVDLLALYASKEDRRVSPDLVIQALQQLVSLPPDHEELPMIGGQLSQYELESLLKYLRGSDVDEEQLGVLEWQFLPALGFDARSPTLERRLARDPAFFVHILSLTYRPRSERTEALDVPEQLAVNAYRLLDEWRIVPGSIEGKLDPEVLNVWIAEARELARAASRVEVGDIQIGKVLAHAPGDEDGTWPTRPVRDVIERIATPELEDGFRTEIYNSRGPTSRGLLDGGAQERVLVEKYDDLADRIRDTWPRVSAVLRSLARGYEREAARQDEEVERFRHGMER
jgi:hypothetical protein